eukprot:s12_g26.t3
MEQMAALEEVLHAQHSELLLRLDKLEAALSRSRRGESRRELRALSTSSMDLFEIPESPSEKKPPEAQTVPIAPRPQIESNAKAKRSATSRYELAKDTSALDITLRISKGAAPEQGNRVEEMKQMQMDSEGDDTDNGCFQDRIRPLRRSAQKLAASLPFNIFFALVIVSNSLVLGFQLEWNARRVMDSQDQTVWIIVHVAYAILFTIEMMIRITAAGPLVYLCGPGWAWNWLDVFVVLPAWVELALDLSAPSEGGDGGASSNLRIVRVFKVTRLLQVVRSVRLIKFLGALRALVMSVVDTTRQLAWALLLLGLVIYSFGILFADAALDYGIRHDLSDDSTLLEYFGGVYLSCQTLFRAILGGLDWEVAVNSLVQVGWFWVQLFHSYIAFCGFAVLNVMTGVFVNSAIKTRERDHETLLQNKQRFKELVSKIWSRMDASGQGQITIIEFEQMFEDEEMKAFFQTIEINAVDAWTLFDSLDVDGDHTISLEEFSERCMQLHGPARSVDLYALVKQIHALGEQHSQMNDCLATLIERTHVVEDSFSLATLIRVFAANCVVRLVRGQAMPAGMAPWPCGLRLGERKLSLKPSEAEPDSVRWASFGGGSRDFAYRCLRAILELTAVILLIMYVLKYPYARYVLSFSYAETGKPNSLNGRFLMLISIIANQIIYLFSDKVAEDLHLWYTEHKQKAYLGFYLVAMILELMMDLFFTARTTFNQLVAAGRRSYGGEKLSDLTSWHEVVQTYVMQNALGNQLLDYAMPSTFLAPFIFEPILGFVAYHLGKLVVRSHAEVSKYDAQETVSWFWVNDLSRYDDAILNLTIAVIFLAIHGGFTSRAFGYLLGCHVYIYLFDHWMLLRAMPRVKYNLMSVDILAHMMMAIPTGIVLVCVVFKANCKDMQEHPLGKLMPFETYCFVSMDLMRLLIMVFVLHASLHVFIVHLLLKYIRVDHSQQETTYAELARTTPCTWFTANPVHCLRSEYLKRHDPPCRFYVPGREHLLRANPEANCHFEDTNYYGVKPRGWHLLSNEREKTPAELSRAEGALPEVQRLRPPRPGCAMLRAAHRFPARLARCDRAQTWQQRGRRSYQAAKPRLDAKGDGISHNVQYEGLWGAITTFPKRQPFATNVIVATATAMAEWRQEKLLPQKTATAGRPLAVLAVLVVLASSESQSAPQPRSRTQEPPH